MNKKTGYERVKNGEEFYLVGEDSEVYDTIEQQMANDEQQYNTANYYSDKTVAEENARADELMRKLRRFAVEHNECELDWKAGYQYKFYIEYDHSFQRIEINKNQFMRKFGQIYFSTEEIAKQAIKEHEDELLWYFTEYCDHIVEAETKECGCELCSSGNLANVGISGDRIAFWGGNNKPNKEQRLGFCPKCGKKLEG